MLKEFFNAPPPNFHWFRGQGCSECHNTGYRGCIAVAELWVPREKDMILINKGAGIEELRKSAYASTILMAEDAMEKLHTGKTNLEELMRTLPFSSIYQFRRIVGKSKIK